MNNQKTENQKRFYYFRDRQESKSNQYTIRNLEIFVSSVKQLGPEITDYYYSGGVKKLIALDYQKGCGKEPQTELEKSQEDRFYSETLANYQTEYPTTELFKELVVLFAKMDKAAEKLRANDLQYEYANDRFLYRVFLLKTIGAKQIEYSSQTHNYYLS